MSEDLDKTMNEMGANLTDIGEESLSKASRFTNTVKESLDDVQQRLSSTDFNWKAILSAAAVIGLGIVAYQARGRSKKAVTKAAKAVSHAPKSIRSVAHKATHSVRHHA